MNRCLSKTRAGNQCPHSAHRGKLEGGQHMNEPQLRERTDLVVCLNHFLHPGPLGKRSYEFIGNILKRAKYAPA